MGRNIHEARETAEAALAARGVKNPRLARQLLETEVAESVSDLVERSKTMPTGEIRQLMDQHPMVAAMNGSTVGLDRHIAEMKARAAMVDTTPLKDAAPSVSRDGEEAVSPIHEKGR